MKTSLFDIAVSMCLGAAVDVPAFPLIQSFMIRVHAHMGTLQSRECPRFGGTTVI